MKLNSIALTTALLSSALLFNVQPAAAQTTTQPNETATRPETKPAEQTSLPNNSPPATAEQTTGAAPKDPVIKKMNEDEKREVEIEGK